jgi:hypothetical protein
MSALLLAAAAAAAATAQDPIICADRPAKANGVCTVSAGHWQLEVSAIDWTHDQNGDSRTDIASVGSTFVKLGLSESSDVELGFSPYVEIRNRSADVRDRSSGFGDVVVRYKRRLSRADAAAQVAFIPFVKLPTAHHAIGNGRVEGGIATAISFTSKSGVSVTFGPEVDILADGDGRGYHPGLTNLVNASVGVTPQLSLSAELWNNLNFDPAGTVRQLSLDGSAALLATNNLQLDAGANVGLNRQTPDLELYAGTSVRF